MADIGIKDRFASNHNYDLFASSQGRLILNLAIYYGSTGWPSLFKKCLGPLMREMKADSSVNRFNLYFCKDQGEHLRLTMNLQGNLQQKTLYYKSSIQDFMDTHPSTRVERPLPLADSFFLDVPNNLVLINSFKPFSANLTQLQHRQTDILKASLSELLLETFSDLNPDKESLFNFYLYLQLVALAVFGDLTEASDWLEKSYQLHCKLMSSADIKKFEDQGQSIMENNLEDMLQVINLIENGVLGPDIQWLAEWYRTCSQFSTSPSPEILFIEIRILISQHINFYDAKLETLVLHILRFLLKKKNTNSIYNS